MISQARRYRQTWYVNARVRIHAPSPASIAIATVTRKRARTLDTHTSSRTRTSSGYHLPSIHKHLVRTAQERYWKLYPKVVVTLPMFNEEHVRLRCLCFASAGARHPSRLFGFHPTLSDGSSDMLLTAQ